MCLCVRQMRPVRYLRGDTGAPAHSLLTAAPRRSPPQCLGAVVPAPRAVPRQQVPPGRVPPRLRGPARLHAAGAPAGPQRPPARARVVVVVVALVAPRGAHHHAPAAAAPPGGPAGGAPHLPRGRVLVPAARGPGEAVAKGLGGEVGKGHVAEAQPHALRVEGLDLAGLALQQAADTLHALVLQRQHLLLDLRTRTQPLVPAPR